MEPAGGFSPWIDPRPCLPTLRAAAEHALWQRIPHSAGTGTTGINRLIRALETS